jgi:hypothetical protein
MNNKYQMVSPVIGPLLALLRSRKFIVAVLTVIVDVLVVVIPALEPVQAELLAVLTVLGSALVAAIAYEDGKTKEAGA